MSGALFSSAHIHLPDTEETARTPGSNNSSFAATQMRSTTTNFPNLPIRGHVSDRHYDPVLDRDRDFPLPSIEKSYEDHLPEQRYKRRSRRDQEH
jgi:hypothetical protein